MGKLKELLTKNKKKDDLQVELATIYSEIKEVKAILRKMELEKKGKSKIKRESGTTLGKSGEKSK